MTHLKLEMGIVQGWVVAYKIHANLRLCLALQADADPSGLRSSSGESFEVEAVTLEVQLLREFRKLRWT